jgi:hypothetical protein
MMPMKYTSLPLPLPIICTCITAHVVYKHKQAQGVSAHILYSAAVVHRVLNLTQLLLLLLLLLLKHASALLLASTLQ